MERMILVLCLFAPFALGNPLCGGYPCYGPPNPCYLPGGNCGQKPPESTTLPNICGELGCPNEKILINNTIHINVTIGKHGEDLTGNHQESSEEEEDIPSYYVCPTEYIVNRSCGMSRNLLRSCTTDEECTKLTGHITKCCLDTCSGVKLCKAPLIKLQK